MTLELVQHCFLTTSLWTENWTACLIVTELSMSCSSQQGYNTSLHCSAGSFHLKSSTCQVCGAPRQARADWWAADGPANSLDDHATDAVDTLTVWRRRPTKWRRSHHVASEVASLNYRIILARVSEYNCTSVDLRSPARLIVQPLPVIKSLQVSIKS